MGTQGRRRLSGVGRGASVSLTADRRKPLSGMDAAQIEGHHLLRESGCVIDQFLMGRFALPTDTSIRTNLTDVGSGFGRTPAGPPEGGHHEFMRSERDLSVTTGPPR